MRWSVVRFYHLDPDRVKEMRVPEVMVALGNINRIRADEAEFAFYTVNAAFNGNRDFLDELKLMRMTPEQRRKFAETRARLQELGFRVRPK